MTKKSLLLCVLALSFILSACAQNDPPSNRDHNNHNDPSLTFFKDLWRASPVPNGLNLGDTWNTDEFSMKFTMKDQSISINFKPKNYSISECFEDGAVFMSAVAYSVDNDTHMFDSELFYMSALLDSVSDHSATATMSVPTDTHALMIILIVDGVVYNEMIFLN